MIYNQSIARRSLLGDESQNPSIAAKSLFTRALGKGRVRRAIARAKKRRRPFHSGNPLPALLGAAGLNPLSILSGLGGRFRKRSEARAAAVAPAVIQAANAGNLVAARGLIERAAHPMLPKESAVWVAALAQLSAKIRAAVTKYAELIPAASQKNPEEFAQSVLSAPPVNLAELEATAAASARESKAERLAAARESRASREATFGTLADVGVAGLQAFAGRGRRRPTQRRRPRRRSSYY